MEDIAEANRILASNSFIANTFRSMTRKLIDEQNEHKKTKLMLDEEKNEHLKTQKRIIDLQSENEKLMKKKKKAETETSQTIFINSDSFQKKSSKKNHTKFPISDKLVKGSNEQNNDLNQQDLNEINENLIDFDTNALTDITETIESNEHTFQPSEIIYEHFKRFSAKLRVGSLFTSFEKAGIILFIKFSMEQKINLNLIHSRPHYKVDGSFTINNAYCCNMCGLKVSTISFDSTTGFVRVKELEPTHVCQRNDIYSIIQNCIIKKNTEAAKRKKNNDQLGVFTTGFQEFVEVRKILDKIDEIELLKLYLIISKTKNLYINEPVEILLSIIPLVQKRPLDTSENNTEKKFTDYPDLIAKSLVNIMGLDNEEHIYQLNQKQSHFIFDTNEIVEKTLKSIKECLRRKTYDMCSSSTSKDDLLSQAIVLDTFHIEQFLIEDNKVMFSNVGGIPKEVLQIELDKGLDVMNSYYISNGTNQMIENTPGSNLKVAEDGQEIHQEFTQDDGNLEFIYDANYDDGDELKIEFDHATKQIKNKESLNSFLINQKGEIESEFEVAREKDYKPAKNDVCHKLIEDTLSTIDEFQLSNNSFLYFQNKLPEELIKKSTGIFELDATPCKIKFDNHSSGEPGEADKVFENLFIVSTKLLNNEIVPIAYGLGGIANSKNWFKMISCFKTCNEKIIDKTLKGNITIIADNQKGLNLAIRSLDSIWLNTKIHALTCSVHLKRNLLKAVSPSQITIASVLFDILLHTTNQAVFYLFQDELVKMILPKYKNNNNTTYKIISQYPEKYSRLGKGHNVNYYECHSTNGVKSFSNRIKGFRATPKINMIINLLMIQQHSFTTNAKEFAMNDMEKEYRLVNHGVILMNQELFKAGLLEIKESTNYSNEKTFEVGIKEELKSIITLETFQDIIFRYNKLINRRCNFISSRTTVYEEFYHANAQVNLEKKSCSVCGTIGQGFSICCHRIYALLNSKEIEGIDDETKIAKDILLRLMPTNQDIIQTHQSPLFLRDFNQIFHEIGLERSKNLINLLEVNSGLIADLDFNRFKKDVCTLTSVSAIKKRIKELSKSKIASRDKNQTTRKRKSPNLETRYVERNCNQSDHIKQQSSSASDEKGAKSTVVQRKVGRPMKRKNLNKIQRLADLNTVKPLSSGDEINQEELEDAHAHERGDLGDNGISNESLLHHG